MSSFTVQIGPDGMIDALALAESLRAAAANPADRLRLENARLRTEIRVLRASAEESLRLALAERGPVPTTRPVADFELPPPAEND